jgi:hypothetical protein
MRSNDLDYFIKINLNDLYSIFTKFGDKVDYSSEIQCPRIELNKKSIITQIVESNDLEYLM